MDTNASEVKAVQEVPSKAAESPNVISVTPQMLGLTWLVFLVLLAVLYKYAWKPILKGLEAREEGIRRALDEAAKAREMAAKTEQDRQKIVAGADAQAKQIIAAARQAAEETARVIEEKARAENDRVLENARREIQSAETQARTRLRRNSAELAVQMAAKVLGQELDPARRQALTEKLIKEM